jgi:putative transposase
VSLGRAAVLRPGDRVVVALAGTSVRLRCDDGAQSVVLIAYLMACPEFSVVNGESLPEVEPFGLLDGLPAKVLQEAREWERHLMEVETGLPPNPAPGSVSRPGYDPVTTSVADRDRVKATELG